MKITITLLAGTLSCAAVASNPGAASPDPRDPRAAVPPLKYESALRGHSATQDVPLARWRDANDSVGALGGHAGHLKSANPARLPPADPGAKP